MSCLVLKRNGSLCRNYACLEQTPSGLVRGFTCRQHQDYFKDSESVKKKWIENVRFSEETWGFGRNLEYYPDRLYAIQECLRIGLVNITCEDILSIKLRSMNQWLCFLVLVARHTPDFLSWSLVGGSLYTLWQRIQGIGPFQYSWRDLQLFLCSPVNLKQWYTGIQKYPYEDPEVGFTKEDFYRFFEDSIQNFPEWGVKFILESEEGIRNNQIYCKQVHPTMKNRNAILLVTSEEFFTWRMSKKADWYKEQKGKCDTFKEELMAVAWHPDRFFSWCLDWKEKEEMNACWRIE